MEGRGSDRDVGDDVRSPRDEAVFQRRDAGFGYQGDRGENGHGSKDAVGVERVLSRGDHQPQTLDGAQVFAHDGADQGEAEAGVQTGDDPAERGRNREARGKLEPDKR